MSPERLGGSKGTGERGPGADIWGVGVTVLESVLGRPPFDIQDGGPLGLVMQIVDTVIDVDACVLRSDSRSTLALAPALTECLVKDHRRRVSVRELRDPNDERWDLSADTLADVRAAVASPSPRRSRPGLACALSSASASASSDATSTAPPGFPIASSDSTHRSRAHPRFIHCRTCTSRARARTETPETSYRISSGSALSVALSRVSRVSRAVIARRRRVIIARRAFPHFVLAHPSSAPESRRPRASSPSNRAAKNDKRARDEDAHRIVVTRRRARAETPGTTRANMRAMCAFVLSRWRVVVSLGPWASSRSREGRGGAAREARDGEGFDDVRARARRGFEAGGRDYSEWGRRRSREGGGGRDVEGGGGEGAKGEIAGRDARRRGRAGPRRSRWEWCTRRTRGWERTDVRGETFVRGARETGGGEGGGDDEDERTLRPRQAAATDDYRGRRGGERVRRGDGVGVHGGEENVERVREGGGRI